MLYLAMFFNVTPNRNKNTAPWDGPYTIAHATPAGLYTLRDGAGALFPHDVPRDQLKVIKEPQAT